VSIEAPRPLKQEQIEATDEITEVAPGILRTMLPIDFTGLGHVNMYVLEDERGVAVVDPGLPNKECWVAIKQRLKNIGVPMRRVHSIIVTHSHPDHFGGAERIRDKSGADVVAHRLFRSWWNPDEPGDLDPEELALYSARPREHVPWGGPDMEIPWKRRFPMNIIRPPHRLVPMPTPSIRLREHDTIKFARREWFAIHTPGHTEDHLCLFDPEEGVLITGDHVLPTITPHVPGLSASDDPLSLFYASLDKVGQLGQQVKVALPAHGNPFHDISKRTEEIKEHHDERLQRLRDTSSTLNKPASVMEFATYLFSPRAQGPMAHSETYAHLEHLRLRGEFECRDNNGILEYVLS